jgi:hypothetical protein
LLFATPLSTAIGLSDHGREFASTFRVQIFAGGRFGVGAEQTQRSESPRVGERTVWQLGGIHRRYQFTRSGTAKVVPTGEGRTQRKLSFLSDPRSAGTTETRRL